MGGMRHTYDYNMSTSCTCHIFSTNSLRTDRRKRIFEVQSPFDCKELCHQMLQSHCESDISLRIPDVSETRSALHLRKPSISQGDIGFS